MVNRTLSLVNTSDQTDSSPGASPKPISRLCQFALPFSEFIHYASDLRLDQYHHYSSHLCDENPSSITSGIDILAQLLDLSPYVRGRESASSSDHRESAKFLSMTYLPPSIKHGIDRLRSQKQILDDRGDKPGREITTTVCVCIGVNILRYHQNVTDYLSTRTLLHQSTDTPESSLLIRQWVDSLKNEVKTLIPRGKSRDDRLNIYLPDSISSMIKRLKDELDLDARDIGILACMTALSSAPEVYLEDREEFNNCVRKFLTMLRWQSHGVLKLREVCK